VAGRLFLLKPVPDSDPHKVRTSAHPIIHRQTSAMKRDHLDAFSLPRIDLLDSPLYSSPQPMTTMTDDFTDSGYFSDRPNSPPLTSLGPQSPYMTVINFHER